jgi:Mitochondrial K+-H+ exchange-related
VNVFLLNVGGRSVKTRPLFYADPRLDEHEEDHGPDRPPEKGIKGWAIARLRRLRDAWQHPHGGVAKFAHRAWDWLHSRTHPDEMLLARLRLARTIVLHHPSSMTDDDVYAAWTTFLRRGRKRHWLWFVVNAVISPLTLILGPLPGPNLVGYWFAYRAVHHWLILVGLRHARSQSLELSLRPTDAIENPPDDTPFEVMGIDEGDLRAFLARHGFRHEAGVENQQSTTP